MKYFVLSFFGLKLLITGSECPLVCYHGLQFTRECRTAVLWARYPISWRPSGNCLSQFSGRSSEYKVSNSLNTYLVPNNTLFLYCISYENRDVHSGLIILSLLQTWNTRAWKPVLKPVWQSTLARVCTTKKQKVVNYGLKGISIIKWKWKYSEGWTKQMGW